MQAITKILSGYAAKAFESCGYDSTLGTVTSSDRLDLCQFQCNGAFAGAKQYRKAPMMIAEEVCRALAMEEIFEKAEAAAPGFINLTLKDSALMALAKELDADSESGIPQPENPETLLIDYGGPNVAKPLHIGHLRSAIIGEALKRLARICGHKVTGDIHLGDWGLQIGLVICGLKEQMPDERCFSEDFDPEKDSVPVLNCDLLSQVYPEASKKSKEDDVFREQAQAATFDLQNRRPGYIALWKEIMRVSIADLKKSYQRLNVDFDLWYGESDADAYVDELMRILTQKELLRESEGALVVDVEKESDKAPMPPIIIKKSDHSNLYATTDLATLIQRKKDFSPDRIWYVVDTRQGLHFEQVFRCAEKAGITDGIRPEFLGFGTMNGADGKPYKTREGGVMRLSDLLDLAENAALEKLESSAYIKSLSGEEKKQIAQKVSVAAVKFGDLQNHRAKDYIFDLDKFLAFEGKTGTYILYTITRINSILKKAGVSPEETPEIKGIYSATERELLLNLLLTGERFVKALEERAPNYICDNAFTLASLFSGFYHDNRVVDEADPEKKESWLALLLLTKKMLLVHLDVLGIEAVENM